MKCKWPIIFTLITIVACGQAERNKVPLAKVGDNYLYWEEVAQVIPENLEEADSSLWVDDFVKKWVRSELIILNAEQNLTFEQKNVEKELNEYRNSLLTYRYKQELINQKMDTVVSANKVDAYYDLHQNNYILKSNIVKAVFLKIPLDVATPENIKEMCNEENVQDLTMLDEYAIQYAKSYDRFNDQWIKTSQVFNQIPDEITDEERFLTRNKFFESSDTDYYYFICIRDYRMEEQAAPVEYVESEIRNILLNERKLKFLRSIEDDIYNEGLASNKFKIFNIKK